VSAHSFIFVYYYQLGLRIWHMGCVRPLHDPVNALNENCMRGGSEGPASDGCPVELYQVLNRQVQVQVQVDRFRCKYWSLTSATGLLTD